jgi:hypothetical protein
VVAAWLVPEWRERKRSQWQAGHKELQQASPVQVAAFPVYAAVYLRVFFIKGKDKPYNH